ncbi:MAG: hypothetical protein J1G30_04085 [Spirochaetales bacterium]|nr:hypothetical protein [Spirochaetales bacterium]
MKRQAKFLTISSLLLFSTSVLLFSASVAMFANSSLKARQTGPNQIEVSFSSNYEHARIWYRRKGDRNWQVTNLKYGSGTLKISNVYPGTYEIKADSNSRNLRNPVFQRRSRIGGDVVLTISDRPASPPSPRPHLPRRSGIRR